MNSSIHSSTGQKPADLLFGKAINLDKGIFLPLDEQHPPDIDTDIPAWIARMAAASQDLIAKAKQTQQQINDDSMALRCKRKRDKNTPTAQIQIGDLALLERPADRPKLSVARTGPYKVKQTARDEITAEDMITGSTKRVRLNNVVKYRQDPDTADASTVAAKDKNMYNVEFIVSYKKYLITLDTLDTSS